MFENTLIGIMSVVGIDNLSINQKKSLAKQVVLTNAEYDTKHSLMAKKNKEKS